MCGILIAIERLDELRLLQVQRHPLRARPRGWNDLRHVYCGAAVLARRRLGTYDARPPELAAAAAGTGPRTTPRRSGGHSLAPGRAGRRPDPMENKGPVLTRRCVARAGKSMGTCVRLGENGYGCTLGRLVYPRLYYSTSTRGYYPSTGTTVSLPGYPATE